MILNRYSLVNNWYSFYRSRILCNKLFIISSYLNILLEMLESDTILYVKWRIMWSRKPEFWHPASYVKFDEAVTEHVHCLTIYNFF